VEGLEEHGPLERRVDLRLTYAESDYHRETRNFVPTMWPSVAAPMTGGDPGVCLSSSAENTVGVQRRF
jgi:hypothetical protein